MLYKCFDCGEIIQDKDCIVEYSGSYGTAVYVCIPCFVKNNSEDTSFDFGVFPKKTINAARKKELLEEINSKSR